MFNLAKVFTFYFLLASTIAHANYTEENLKLTTSRGEEIDVTVLYPESNVKLPAVLLASGGGYHKDLPILKQSTEAIADNGIIAVRFNWNYFTKKENPSQGYVAEQEDMQTVLDFLKSNEKVDATKILIGGKSLGSVISYRVFTENEFIRALLLYTPVCTQRWDKDGNELPVPEPIGQVFYPEILSENRQVVITMGNRDPNCDVPMIYNFLKGSNGNVALNMVKGDHSLNIGPWDDPTYQERNAKNIEAAIGMQLHWVKLILD